MRDLLMDTWKLKDDPAVTVTCIGTLYYYNEAWVEDSGDNNRLIFVYHIENGVVPGGWYTYLGPNGNVLIKRFLNEDGYYYHSTVPSSDLYDQPYMSYLWLECMKEYYSDLIDTEHPVSFVYSGTRYMGHTTVEDCITALYENSFKEWDLTFDHMVASGEMKNYVSDY